jgi:hypothetical protein
VTLRWNAKEAFVGVGREEWPIDRMVLMQLVAEFDAIPARPADPAWIPGAKLRDTFWVGGACDDEDALAAVPEPRRLEVLDTLRVVPLEDAPRTVVLSLRGPGPRAARLLERIKRIAAKLER